MADKTSKWVVKIGSSLITAGGRGLDHAGIAGWVDQIAALMRNGHRIVLVSSGAVAEGMSRLDMSRYPHSLHLVQAAAAVGQMGLVQSYESSFQRHGLHTAQVLLTHDDVKDRERYINARATLNALIDMHVIPVVNENDTVVTDEIRFGDNDTLAALVANLIEADLLVMLTDQPGMFDSDPRLYRDAKLVEEAKVGDSKLDRMAGGSSSLGRGGMISKVRAARMAARSGASTVIASGREDGVILKLAAGERVGSLLRADSEVLAARKQWLAGLQARGKLVLDDGAVRVLQESGRSLLPVGVQSVSGDFSRGEMVACYDQAGSEVARGLVNYSVAETRSIIGHPSEKIEVLLGYIGEEELIHRDNMVVL